MYSSCILQNTFCVGMGIQDMSVCLIHNDAHGAKWVSPSFYILSTSLSYQKDI